ncbi:Na(+)/H(+) antiporter NhaD [Tsuneonella dongtanensis]|uniref:Na(+)/H(+) antiporter NhaD n=1 Tax=Tsuneonella dongtanensis TaxID=692370 RepID=A0A1B2AFL2_9SPHN|nr:sodium:proton antiporter NhaD [Tsuneonella dongtanensis]ANY20911.1 Na(+)/H(+) antiporter NhaD [Tsuneonella dongtanensis]
MVTALVIVFVLAYVAIALEEPLRTNKSAAALIGAGLLWSIYALATGLPEVVDEQLNESLIETAQIAFFLLGAMTIVEVIDAHDGFDVITSRLQASTLATLMLFICGVTFFLSAILDNLTTTIVMISLCRRLLREQSDLLLFAGMIVISANAGGAWSPMGDVTTTMLWIGGQVTALAIVTKLIVPSLINMAVPLAIVAWSLRGKPILAPETLAPEADCRKTTPFERNLMFTAGLAALVSVPLFKTITHLPPFLGVLFGLGILWAIGDRIHREKPYEERQRVTIANALARIDMSAITFFIGILLAVATLQHAGILGALANWLDETVGRLDVIVMIIGLVSAIVDNVPMVAGAMGMYSIEAHPTDSFLWEFLAYCAGTGGSILIIGSAAGVAAMGIAKIDFIWYMKRFSLLALIGYLAGAGAYIAQEQFLRGAGLI